MYSLLRRQFVGSDIELQVYFLEYYFDGIQV